jgi:hypothetical protein
VLVTEAMKMETEIQAPIAGRVTGVFVQKGDAVNPDEVCSRSSRPDRPGRAGGFPAAAPGRPTGHYTNRRREPRPGRAVY